MSTQRLHLSPTGGLAAVVALGLIAALVHHFLSSNTERATFVEPIALLAPPPAAAPPPPKKVEPDPPDRVEPVDKRDLTAGMADEPPGPTTQPAPGTPAPGPLGLDEAGAGGGDAFGLAGRPGGRELLLTGGGGGGNPNARFLRFASQLQSHVEEQLRPLQELQQTCYRLRVQIRVAANGSLEDVKIPLSSGDAALDSRIRDALLGIAPLQDTPPADMPWPITLQLVSHTAGCKPHN